jgi:hypothetical protein
MCEAAVAQARGSEGLKSKLPQYLDSRGVAYAAFGRFEAVSDFLEFLTKGDPKSGEAELRREWIDALRACKLHPVGCQMRPLPQRIFFPLADAVYLHTIN